MQNIIDFIFPIRLIPPTDLLPKSLQTEIKVKKKKRQKTGITGEHKTWIRLCQMQPYSDPKNHVPIKLPTRKFKFDYERDAELYSNLWIKYLRFKLAPVTYKRVLVYLDKYAIQHFSNPLLLADFLINSFKTGGIISLLSLSPLYILIGKCNLEYPNFYDQLYQLVEPAIVYVKYRPRFLFWCDLFLTSTHISANIAASFVKLMARLALSSPPDTILVLLPFIGNLLIRNPAIQSMLIAKQFDPENDPFNSDEPIPTKTNAINSYLWELKALQSHFLPSIAEMAKKIATNLPTHEWDLSDILETDMDDVMEKATKSMMKSDKFTYDLACDLFYSL
ncbi:hypothetical protein RDWZM_003495 [Blomia tropicalis]|uniref:CCAAT-binding factor domain-containing protein n=1 Tax=Blomia tropicalis TaxID=40697 RepID=A0A9Q0RSQ8_BLOTA|nr:hypothetical protein RDWZM_003495 [Blomia tropicalis]